VVIVERLCALLGKLPRSERGEVYVEYVVLGALATLVILAAVQYFFGGLAEMFTRMGDLVRGIG
jgi:Flp pilus assembly pilin Flp